MDKSKKVYKKINKTGIVGTIITFLIFGAFSAFLLITLYLFFTTYAIESKIQGDYWQLADIADDMADDSITDTQMKERLDRMGGSYVILDGNRNIIQQKGDASFRTDDKGIINRIGTRNIRGYIDKSDSLVQRSFYGGISLSWKKLLTSNLEMPGLSDFEINLETKENDEDYDEDEVGFTYNTEFQEKYNELMDERYKNDHDVGFLEVPLWLEYPVEQKDEFIVYRTVFDIKLRDADLAIEIFLLTAVFVSVVLHVLLIMGIVNFVRQRRILNMFLTDTVTGGHNWMWFLIKGEHLLKKRSVSKIPYAMVSMSMVNYRSYTLCHSVRDGERLLKKLNYSLSRELRPRELMAHATTGEFSLILRAENDDDLKQRLNTIIGKLSAIESPHVFHFHAGVNVMKPAMDENGRIHRRKNVNIEDEYNKACAAKNRLLDNDDSAVSFFDTNLVDEEKWVDAVNEKQMDALKNEEYKVYYQPKYDPRTNELKGAEALIRWESPEFGFVTPNRIIPIFEKNGFIVNIDNYMITHVARDQKMWLDKGLKCVPVSVNVSRAHFVDADLAEQIRDMVDREGAPHNLIEIELTESAFFDDKKAMITTIKKLKNYGFQVSMDDFGAGYSSLNSLKDMPLDVLKLDADFFRGENAGERGDIVVKEAIKLAKSLNMRTVAEGVEEKEQVDFLAEQGCDMIQGYYYAKPMPKTDYETRMH